MGGVVFRVPVLPVDPTEQAEIPVNYVVRGGGPDYGVYGEENPWYRPWVQATFVSRTNPDRTLDTIGFRCMRGSRRVLDHGQLHHPRRLLGR